MNNKNELVNKLYTLRACLSYIAQKADMCRAYSNIIYKNNEKIALMEGNIRKTKMSIQNSEKMIKEAETEIDDAIRWGKFYNVKEEFFLGLGFALAAIIVFVGNKHLKANYDYPWWAQILSVLSYILVGLLVVFTIGSVGGSIESWIKAKKEAKKTKRTKGNLIAELKRTIESTNKTLSAQMAEYSVNKKAYDFNNNQHQKQINNETRLAQTVYNEIKNQMRGILDQSDWKHLDIIIYYLNTGRADTIKEALQQLDRHLQAESIKNEIRSASSNITSEIRSMKQDIKAAINDCASVISRQIQVSTEQTNNLIDDKMSGLIEVQENILTERQLQNALIEKHNQTSQALVEECKNLRLGL